MTRTCSGSRPRFCASTLRRPQTPWVPVCNVSRCAARIPLGDAGARLHRVADHPVVDQLELDHPRRLGERRLHRRLVAIVPVEGEIARRLGMDLRRARRQGAWRCRPPPAGRRTSTSISSAASFACSRVSATTNATLSPTWLTSSRHRIGCFGSARSVPSRLVIGMKQGSPASISAAVATSQHARRRLGGGRVEADDARVGGRRAQHVADAAARAG